jgi:hypothetical protein
MLTSEIMHCTAPSPAVYPDVELCEQRQSNVGVVEQVVERKFTSKNDLKHSCAQDGMNFVISDVRV